MKRFVIKYRLEWWLTPLFQSLTFCVPCSGMYAQLLRFSGDIIFRISYLQYISIPRTGARRSLEAQGEILQVSWLTFTTLLPAFPLKQRINYVLWEKRMDRMPYIFRWRISPTHPVEFFLLIHGTKSLEITIPSNGNIATLRTSLHQCVGCLVGRLRLRIIVNFHPPFPRSVSNRAVREFFGSHMDSEKWVAGMGHFPFQLCRILQNKIRLAGLPTGTHDWDNSPTTWTLDWIQDGCSFGRSKLFFSVHRKLETFSALLKTTTTTTRWQWTAMNRLTLVHSSKPQALLLCFPLLAPSWSKTVWID